MSGDLLVRAGRVRSRSRGAATFSAMHINEQGEVRADADRLSVCMPDDVAVAEVQSGQWWLLRKWRSRNVQFEVDGFFVRETCIVAQEAELVRPSGEHVVQLLHTSDAFPGVGEVKARRLWERFGEDLYCILDDGDTRALSEVVGGELAAIIVAGWKQYGDAKTLRSFQRMGLDLRVSRRLMTVYAARALSFIEEDPYRLLAFGMTWSAVDALARGHFGRAPDHPQRLAAAVEAVVYEHFDLGHTCCSEPALLAEVSKRVGKEYAAQAFSHARAQNLVTGPSDSLAGIGPHLIEKTVSEAVLARTRVTACLKSPQQVNAFIQAFETAEGKASGTEAFSLNVAQRQAVHLVVQHSVCLITGGAGVGKTTVLKAVQGILVSSGLTLYAMALSGRAAKRLSEATGKPAMTIAGFLGNVAPKGIPPGSVVVLDEASMLDILLAYRLVRAIPADCRIILIGDPAQLPPVGPGLTLHAMVEAKSVPQVELTEVRRFGGVIATAAKDVRNGAWPELGESLGEDISFIPCGPSEIDRRTLDLYLLAPAGTQILTFTRTSGPASSQKLNELCQRTVAPNQPKLMVFNNERNRMENLGLRLGEPVICTRNLADWGLQNGSLGQLDEIAASPEPVYADDGSLKGMALAWVTWDDHKRRPVTEEVLDALELAYAITVHKAQGSQFSRVVVPVYKARNLDRTMLYTAITRAKEQVVLLGDIGIAQRVTAEPPLASRRQVALGAMLSQQPRVLEPLGETPCS
jgi:exodeoxyribonuclease V alpha subunit